jgi:hypothetical protein
MDRYPGVGWIVIGFVGVPADVAGTYDSRRCAGGRKCQQGGSGEGGFGQNSHRLSPPTLLIARLPTGNSIRRSPQQREKTVEFRREIGVALVSGSDGRYLANLVKLSRYQIASIGRRDRMSPVPAGDCIVAIAGVRLNRYSVKKCAASNMLIEKIAAIDALTI